jgi:K(+)-stimulated pyrophosphate-energized sodium pump
MALPLELLGALAASVLAILFALALARHVVRLPPGNERMQEISAAIRSGAMAYLNRQFRTISLVGVLIFVVVWAAIDGFGRFPFTAVAFLVGAGFSGIAAYIGMSVSVRTNVRTAEAASRGLEPALQTAFRGGAVNGMSIVGLAVLGTAGFYWLYHHQFGLDVGSTLEALIGFAFGASLISLFARVGGGIYTKAADVGADLVGKIEAGIPEDDPRNPAVIADNVGDNVGDCAGMGADLFETYAVTAIAAVLLGHLLVMGTPAEAFEEGFVLFPLLLGAVAIVASLIGVFFVRLGKSGNIMGAMYKAVAVTTLLSAAGFYWAAQYSFGLVDFSLVTFAPSWQNLFMASLVGLAVTVGMIVITEYYTSTKYDPVKRIARASETGAGTNVISGLAVGLQSTFYPVLLIGAAIILSYSFAGLYGIAIAAVGMLSTTGVIVAIDTFGPITDNAGGIAEMSHLPPEVRVHTDALDAVGNTTKAVTKGYAIGSAALAALALFADYVHRLEVLNPVNLPLAVGVREVAPGQLVQATSPFINFQLSDPTLLVGLFIGAVLPFLFSSFAMEAVGKAAHGVVNEVRRQFREIPGIMEGTAKPNYAECVDIVTKSALREMIAPGLIAVVAPIVVGWSLGPIALGGLLIGVIASGFLVALMMANSGGAWDNAKKLIESGEHGGKGSTAHKAAVVGDTVGDPYKDTAGPAINALIKVINTISLLFVAVFVHQSLGVL